jgi:hypothetical protein
MQLMQFFINRGTQLVCLRLKTRSATDTLEAVISGRNWYNFLTAGRNSYFPPVQEAITLNSSPRVSARWILTRKMNNISWRKQTLELQSTASYFGLQTPSFDSRKRSRPLLSTYSNHFISIIIRSCTKYKIIPYGRVRREKLSSDSWFSPFISHSGEWINWMNFLWFFSVPA